jgi:hypothetical protein
MSDPVISSRKDGERLHFVLHLSKHSCATTEGAGSLALLGMPAGLVRRSSQCVKA